MPTTPPAGAKFECNNGGAGAYQDIGALVKINGVDGQTFALVVATALASTAAERTCGLPTNSTITMDFKYTRATRVQLAALRGRPSEAFNFRFTNRGGDTVVVTGCLYDVPGIDNDTAESTTPEMINGVKFWVNTIVSFSAGLGTEGG